MAEKCYRMSVEFMHIKSKIRSQSMWLVAHWSELCIFISLLSGHFRLDVEMACVEISTSKKRWKTLCSLYLTKEDCGQYQLSYLQAGPMFDMHQGTHVWQVSMLSSTLGKTGFQMEQPVVLNHNFQQYGLLLRV